MVYRPCIHVCVFMCAYLKIELHNSEVLFSNYCSHMYVDSVLCCPSLRRLFSSCPLDRRWIYNNLTSPFLTVIIIIIITIITDIFAPNPVVKRNFSDEYSMPKRLVSRTRAVSATNDGAFVDRTCCDKMLGMFWYFSFLLGDVTQRRRALIWSATSYCSYQLHSKRKHGASQQNNVARNVRINQRIKLTRVRLLSCLRFVLSACVRKRAK